MTLTLPEIETPYLWIDLDAMEKNARRVVDVARRAKTVCRPFLEGIRGKAIPQCLQQAGITRAACATVSTVASLTQSGFPDVLLTRQLASPRILRDLVDVCAGAQVTVTVDHYTQVEMLATACSRRVVRVGVVIQLDTGSGTGLRPGAETIRLARAIDAFSTLEFRGLTTTVPYPATDESPRLPGSDVRVGRLISHCRDQLQAAGLACPMVILPELEWHMANGAIDEVLIGDRILASASGWSRTEEAAFIVATVVSRPSLTLGVVDAGPFPPEHGVPPRLPDYPSSSVIRSNDDSTVIELCDDARDLRIGDNVKLTGPSLRTAMSQHARIAYVRPRAGESTNFVTDRVE